MLFLTNTEVKKFNEITIDVGALGGVIELDPVTGRAYRYDSEIKDNRTVIKTKLEPSGSKIFLIDQSQTLVESEVKSLSENALTIEGPYSFKRLQENSLTIDHAAFEMDNKILMENAPLYKVKQELWNKTGIGNFAGYQPWVLKEKNIRSQTNETVLTYKFNVKDIPETISLAMETSDRFKVEINGNKIDFSAGRWHIDRRVRVLNLEDYITEGINTIRAATDFLWDTEIENIYIFGDFAIGSEQDGFPIIKEPKTLETGDWCSQGYPFYSGSIIYTMEIPLQKEDSARYEIDLSDAEGSIFNLTVNNVEVGAISFPPFRGDITGALKNGDNTIEIEVVGSLRNILGPHHHRAGDNLELTGPEAFCDESNWTDSYNFVSYGLIKPPKLIVIK